MNTTIDLPGTVTIPVTEYNQMRDEILDLRQKWHKVSSDDDVLIMWYGSCPRHPHFILKDEAMKYLQTSLNRAELELDTLKNKPIPFSLKRRLVKDL